MQLKCKDNLGRNFKENLQRELPSFEFEISLKLMELLRPFTNSVSEDHENQQALRRKRKYWKVFSEVRESLYDRLVVRLEFQNHPSHYTTLSLEKLYSKISPCS